jgi:hypothetical protein
MSEPASQPLVPQAIPVDPAQTPVASTSTVFSGMQMGFIPGQTPAGQTMPAMHAEPTSQTIPAGQTMPTSQTPQILSTMPAMQTAPSSVPPQPNQTDVVQAVASAVPQYIQEQTDTLNPSYGNPTTVKEVQPGITLERPQFDVGSGFQVSESEPPHEMEMSPEVDGYLKKVENQPDQLPQEVVIVNDPQAPMPTKYLAKPVIVLPITPEIEKRGSHQSPKQSIRWLVAWSQKIMKMFSGQIVYRSDV